MSKEDTTEDTVTMEGKQATDFELEGTDRKRHRLSDYRGKTVVLYFYPKDSTPGCTREACAFRDSYAEWQGLDAVVLGVSRDSLQSHDRFVAAFDLPFILLSDPDTAVMQQYGAYGEKIAYGKKSIGTIRSTVVIGPDGKGLRHWPRVTSAADHPAEVLTFLKALK